MGALQDGPGHMTLNSWVDDLTNNKPGGVVRTPSAAEMQMASSLGLNQMAQQQALSNALLGQRNRAYDYQDHIMDALVYGQSMMQAPRGAGKSTLMRTTRIPWNYESELQIETDEWLEDALI